MQMLHVLMTSDVAGGTGAVCYIQMLCVLSHGLCGSLHKVCIFFFAMAPMPSLCTVKKAEFRTKKKRYQINKFLGLFGYKTRFLQ